VEGVKNIVVLICDKYYVTLGDSPMNTKPYKEIKGISSTYIHACDENTSSVGGNGNSNNNNLSESSRSKRKTREI